MVSIWRPKLVDYIEFANILLEASAVKPASSTVFSKNACLKRRTLLDGFQRSLLKYEGPAVIAAGVGNPPAPAVPGGVQVRVQDVKAQSGQIRL